MDILVIGATGTMGSAVVDRMSSKGHKVYAFSRRPIEKTNENIIPIVGDAFDSNCISEVLKRKYDCVLDFLWHSESSLKKHFDIICNNCGQYIFMSSSAVYTDQGMKRINEKSPRFVDCIDRNLEGVDSSTEYHMVKGYLENCAYESKYHNWTIARPNLVFSPSSLRIGLYAPELWSYRAVHGRTIVMPKEIMDKATSYFPSHDAAKVYEILIGNPKALSEAFNIASEETLTLREVCECIRIGMEEEGYGFKIHEVTKEKFFEGIPSSKSRILRDRIYDRVFDMSKVKELGDYTVSDIKQELINCAKINANNDKYKNPFRSMIHGSAWMDRLCHEHTHLSEILGKKNKAIYLIGRYGPSYKLSIDIYRKLTRK